jgi:hypothetical protein
MSRWVDFRELRQGLSIEQVLTSYRVPLQRVGLHQLRGPCPLPTHGSERSRNSFSVDTAKNVWACHSASCCEARQGRVGGNVLDLVACLEGCSLRQAALRLQEEWRGAGMAVGEPLRASKGSPTNRGLDRPHPLSFSLRLGWHPYLEERAVDPATAAWFGVGYYAGGGFLRHRIVFPIHDPEDNWWRMPAAAWMMASRGICSRQAFPSHRWSLISIVRCGNRRSGRWWWKDSLTACECIKLAIATWRLCWEPVFRSRRKSYCLSAFHGSS